MPLKDKKARQAYEAQRRAGISADPSRLARRQAQNRAAMRRYAQNRPERIKANTKRWGDKHRKDWHRQYKYGVTPERYQQMLERQGGVCAICRRPERAVDPRTGKPRSLAVDHDHDTGMVRGLLCYTCNVGIGMLGHDKQLLNAAHSYLEAACEGD